MDTILASQRSMNSEVRIYPGDTVEATASGADCGGKVTQAPEDANHAYIWCVYCRAAHILQNPLHRFWRKVK